MAGSVSRSNQWLLVATGLGTAAGVAVGAQTGRTNWPVYLVVVAVGVAGVVAVDRRHRLSLPTRVGLVVFALGHVAGGMVPVGDGVLYAQWIVEPVMRYDNLQHAVGFGFVGRAIWEVARPRIPAPSRGLVWSVVVLGACTAGAINEIVEWVLTLTIPGTDVGGYDNTARDLVANLVGGLAVGWWTSASATAAAAPGAD